MLWPLQSEWKSKLDMILFKVWLHFKAKTQTAPEGEHGPFHYVFGLLPPVLQELFLSLICFLCCSVLSLFFHLPSHSRPSPYFLLSNLFSSLLSSPSCLSSSLVVPFPSPLSQQLLPTAIFGIEWEQAILVTLLWNNWEEQMIFFEQIEDVLRGRQASKVKMTLLGSTCPAGSSFPISG